MTYSDEDSWKTLQLCCQALDDKKAEDLVVLRVKEISTVADYFILATGNSEPHLRSLTEEILKVLKEAGIGTLGSEKGGASGWNVIDTFDILVHVFLPETRTMYRLDALWRDGEVIDVQQIVDSAPSSSSV